MSEFTESLNEDLDRVFFDAEAFGDSVTLVRGNDRIAMNGLFDRQALEEVLESEVSAISHRPRLSVRKVDLPGQVALKDDVFEIAARSGFYKGVVLRAADFADQADGTVTYQLVLVKKVQDESQNS